MIRFSAGLVVIAIGVLIGGVATSKLSLVYIAIAVSAVALLVLAIGVVLKRKELFGEGSPVPVPAGGLGGPAGGGDQWGNGTGGFQDRDRPAFGQGAPGTPFQASASLPGHAAGHGGPGSHAAPDAPGRPGFGQPVPGQSAAGQSASGFGAFGHEPLAPLGSGLRPGDPVPGRTPEPAAPWQTPAARDRWSAADPVRGRHQPGEPDSGPGTDRDARAAGGWPAPAHGSGHGGWGSPDAPGAGTSRPSLPGRHGKVDAEQPPYPDRAAPAASFTPAAPPPPWMSPSAPKPDLPGPAAQPREDRSLPSFQPAASTPAPAASLGEASSTWFGRSAGSAPGADRTNGAAGKSTSGPGTSGPGTSHGNTADAEEVAAAATAARATTASSDLDATSSDDDDWPGRYSWLEDEDEPAEPGEPGTASTDASSSGAGAPAGLDADKADKNAGENEEGPAASSGTPGAVATGAGAGETGPDGESGDDAGDTVSMVGGDESDSELGTSAKSAASAKPAASGNSATSPESAMSAKPDPADEPGDASGPGAAGAPQASDGGTAASAGPVSDAGLVTVVPGVPRYHEGNCILIRFMADGDVQRLTVEKAKEAGCTPCAACQPGD